MKGPKDSGQLIGSTRARGITRGARRPRRPSRPRVAGGKALARQLFFREQRDLDPTVDTRATLPKLLRTSAGGSRRKRPAIARREIEPPSRSEERRVGKECR